MTIIAVQCRLSSSRLTHKALLPLGEIELVRWTLRALQKVTVDEYWLACDEDSYAELSKIAHSEGWQCFSGPKDDVLERYCLLAEKTGADTILRATADNPYLFYEAATESLKEFAKKKYDYFAFAGLPHGSGVEVFSAKAILKARRLTDEAYDHEHVGPALYNHKDIFNTVFLKAPNEWTHVNDAIQYRTTVDTAQDYRHVHRIHHFLQEKGCKAPYTSSQIFEALRSETVQKPVLFIPAVMSGRGTGHVRRVITLIEELKKNHGIVADILLTQKCSSQVSSCIQSSIETSVLHEYNIVKELPINNEYATIVFDSYKLDASIAKKLNPLSTLIALDDGSNTLEYIDYALDIIPSLTLGQNKNSFNPSLLGLLQSQRKNTKTIQKVLISIGGEDPLHFSEKISAVLSTMYSDTPLVIDNTHTQPVSNLKDIIHTYDLVITHFGFTAFEAANAGCALITVATSPTHVKLSKKYDLICLKKADCTQSIIKTLLQNQQSLMPKKLCSILQNNSNENLSDTIHTLVHSHKYHCPVCGKKETVDKVVSRDTVKTIRKCSACSMLYVSFSVQEEKEYQKNYFFDEYKNQYGKTYLEDFEAIKAQGSRRAKIITNILQSSNHKTILDIGCAYGPFLVAAKDVGFIPFGLDISKDAVEYVKNTLKINAKTADFSSNCMLSDIFGSILPKNGTFDAITMWYVIEHFQNLDCVLKKVSKSLKIGGVFAFSTPNASGISKKTNANKFFTQSPYDHFSIWEAKNASKILKKYGFVTKKIVTTGIHKNRFPKLWNILPDNLHILFAQMFRLGDTFEVYCIKTAEFL